MALEHLTLETFKTKVFDFENNKEWKFEGKVPALIDFYADWCGPCKMIAPVLEDLQQEFGDTLTIYKIDTEEERELAGLFGIQSIPSLLFIPMEEQPQMAMGALPKETLIKAISEVLKVNKN
jgi:thioredoxin 1